MNYKLTCFNKLPTELILHIWSYDNTIKENYNNCMSELQYRTRTIEERLISKYAFYNHNLHEELNIILKHYRELDNMHRGFFKSNYYKRSKINKLIVFEYSMYNVINVDNDFSFLNNITFEKSYKYFNY